jgi:hypothetical protein
VEHDVTTATPPNPADDRPEAGIMDGQAPIALIGLLAIGVILAINFMARPHSSAVDSRLQSAPACRHCGTIVAVRRSSHSVPVYYVDVRMPDGSVKTLREQDAGYSVGDVVEVNGAALTQRDVF